MPQEERTFRYLAHIHHGHNEKKGNSLCSYDPDETNRISAILRLPEFLKAKGSLLSCLYCGHKLATERRDHLDPFNQQRLAYDSTVISRKCSICSWWYIQVEYTADHLDFELVDRGYNTYEGAINRFSNEKWREPILQVEQELREYRKGLASISGREMEKVVGELIAQHKKCVVKHIGRSRDGGIDLLIVEGDTTTAIQVKHRNPSRSRKSEGVKCVREFVGALIGGNYSRGLFVTTDEAFSMSAKNYADEVSRVFIPIDLVTILDLRKMIGNVQGARWSEYDRLWAEVTGEKKQECK